MIQRHIFIYIILLVGAIIVPASCSEKSSENKVEEDVNLKVAVTPTLDCLPIIIAVDKGWAEKAKLPLDITMYQAHNDCDTALTNGRVVAGFTENIRAKLMADKGVSLVLMRHDNLSWMLIACGKQRITQTSQLKDKMIAMTRLSATELLSQHVMDAAKLTVQQTFLIPVNSLAIRLKMLDSNEMDAAWLPQPQARQALTAGGRSLTTSQEQGLDIYGVAAFPTKAKKGHKVLTEAERALFKKLYNEACDSLNKHGMETYSQIITSRLGITDKDIKSLGKQLFRHL